MLSLACVVAHNHSHVTSPTLTGSPSYECYVGVRPFPLDCGNGPQIISCTGVGIHGTVHETVCLPRKGEYSSRQSTSLPTCEELFIFLWLTRECPAFEVSRAQLLRRKGFDRNPILQNNHWPSAWTLLRVLFLFGQKRMSIALL